MLTVLVLFDSSSTATATRSLGLEGETRLTLTGTITFAGEGLEVTCNTTVTKTLSSVIPKTERTVIGRSTGISTSGCRGTGNSLRALNLEGASSWRFAYKSFLGTLPNPTGYRMKVENVQVLLELFTSLVACLYEGSFELLVTAENSGRGNLERFRTTESSPETVELGLRTTLKRGLPPPESESERR